MEKVRILVVDDHSLVLEGIRGALAKEQDIEIVGEATSGAQLLSLLARTSADVVVLDLRLPDVEGLTCLDLIRQRHPAVKVIILSVCAEPAQVCEALEHGASSYIVKSIETCDLAAAIRQTVSGAFFCPGCFDQARNGEGVSAMGLTGRQVEILQAVTRGLSNRAIAHELWLSDQTVKFHLHNIYRTLGVRNRTEAAKYAHDHGLVAAPV